MEVRGGISPALVEHVQTDEALLRSLKGGGDRCIETILVNGVPASTAENR